MFARILDFEVKLEKKEEFLKVLKNQIVPILKKQVGFLEILPFFPERVNQERALTITLWTTRSDAERYERDTHPRVLEILKPFLTAIFEVKHYKLESAICERFVEALSA